MANSFLETKVVWQIRLSLVQESAIGVSAKELHTNLRQFLSGDHLQAALQSVDNPESSVATGDLDAASATAEVLVGYFHGAVDTGSFLQFRLSDGNGFLNEVNVFFPALDQAFLLDQLEERLSDKAFEKLLVLRRIVGQVAQFVPGILEETLAVVVTRLEHSETRLILQIRHLNLLLQLDMFLLALVKLHDLDSLLLHQTSFLDVELFLRLGVDFFDLLMGLLVDKGHHLHDLLLDIIVAQSHLR